MLKVKQAFDRSDIAELPTDDAESLERKLTVAARLHADRRQWIPVRERVAILRRLADLMTARREPLALQIAREGGKPLADARVETDRAIAGVHIAIEVLRCEGAGRSRWDRRRPAKGGARSPSGSRSAPWPPSRPSTIRST